MHSLKTIARLSGVIIFVCASTYSCTAQSQLSANVNIARVESEQALFQPAGLLHEHNFRFDLYSARLYGLSELGIVKGFLTVPLSVSRLGVSVTSFGGKLYSETGLGVMHVKLLGSSVSLSNEIHYLSVSIKEMGGRSDYSYSAGAAFSLSKLQLGIRFKNIVSGGNAHSGEIRKKAVQAGFTGVLTPGLIISAGFFKQQDYPAVAVVEGRLTMYNTITFTIANGINPSIYAIGAEIQKKRFRFMYNMKHHSLLGNTHQFGFSIFIRTHDS
ncbi:hypothetical protein ACFL5L_02350 [candidate division KSB1 bacterium]